MTQPLHREVAILNAALELSAGARAAHLDIACAGDAALRRRVEELLQAHEQAGGFMEAPPAGFGFERTVLVTVPLTEKPGDKIGRYKLLQQIGEGGCGVVYMAEQEEPVRRRVALKVIKLGMDTRQVIARFEAERQALALMDHPNIAKVFDAGATETGRPYFVMELVRGIKITDYCDQSNLSTRERLDLFIQVCQAVQHAHQKGVIHRDIKPSNILVTLRDGVPVPKVIDFGIAKATTDQPLTDKTLFTAFEQFMGTPAYMSPEQAEMSELGIDTRSDIYSLGVLLYELLTGRTPFDAKELLQAGLEALRRTIREQEPARPSTRLSTLIEGELSAVAKRRQTDAPKLIHLLRGDLDWIVMKSLEKDRARRYETANGLARDIERHLNSEPVVARPPSGVYRFQKLVRRNRLVFAAATLVAASLVIGCGVSTWMYFNARSEKRKAQVEAAKATAISDFLQQMLSSANPDALKGSEYTVRKLLDDFSSGLQNQFNDQPEVEATVRATIGRAYYRLGVADKAQIHHERALALRRRLFGDRDERVAESLVDYAWASFEQGQFAKGEAKAREALDIYHRRGTTGQPLVNALWADQKILSALGRYTEMDAVTEEALTLARNSPGREFPEVASMIHGLAEVRIKQSRYPEAEALALKAVAMHRRLRREGDLETAWALVALGDTLRREKKLDEAERALREALGSFRRQYAPGHKSIDVTEARLKEVLESKGDLTGLVLFFQNTLADRRAALGNDNPAVAETLMNLADALQAQGKQTDAEKASGEALEIALKVNGQITAGTPSLVQRQAQTLKDRGKSQEAEKLFEAAINIAGQKLGETSLIVGELLHDYGEFLNRSAKWEASAEQYIKSLPIRRPKQDDNLAWTLRNLGGVLLQARRPAEAAPYLRESLTLFRKLHQEEEINGTAWTAENLAGALYQSGELAEAEKVYREALVAYSKTEGSTGEGYARMVESLVRVLISEKKLAQGETFCREILAERRATLSNDSPVLVTALLDLAGCLKALSRSEDATKWRREALAIVSSWPADETNSIGPLAPSNDQSVSSRKALGQACLHLAERAALAAQPEIAERAARRAVVVFKQLVREDPGNSDYPTELGHSQWQLGGTLLTLGRRGEAEEILREALQVFAGAATHFPHIAFLHQEHGYSAWTLASVLESGGRLDAAEIEYRRAIALHEQAIADFPGQAVFPERLGRIRRSLVLLLCRRGRPSDARAMYPEVVEHGSATELNELAWVLATGETIVRDGTNAVIFAEKAVTETKRKDASYLDTLAAAYAETGQFAKATSVQREALALSKSEQERNDLASRLRLFENGIPYRDAASLATLATDRLIEGKFDEAERLARECLAIRAIEIPDDWRTFNIRSVLGGALLGQTNYAAAEPLLLSGYEGMKQREDTIPPQGRPRLGEALQRLVQLYEATDRPDQAAEWKRLLAAPDKAEK